MPWCEELFPGRSPAELTVAGKEFCRHVIDAVSREPVEQVLILDSCRSRTLKKALGNGAYWSLRLDYRAGEFGLGAGSLLRQPEFAAERGDILLIRGLVLPAGEPPARLTERLRPVPDGGTETDGIYLFRRGRLYECLTERHRIVTLQDYFALNFTLLSHPGGSVLPGYATENGVHLGSNVILYPGCEVESPALIRDDVCLRSRVRLENGAVIGCNVMIDKGATVSHSVILDHTFIGQDMLIRDKIVSGSRVIDPGTGVFVDLAGDCLVGDMSPHRPDGCRELEAFLALILALATMPFYFLTMPIKKWLKKHSPACRFVLESYPKYWQVLSGRAQLVRYGKGNQEYVFRYSDLWPLHTEEEQKHLDDLYFYYHRTALRIAAVVFGSLLKRLFATPDQIGNRRPRGPRTGLSL